MSRFLLLLLVCACAGSLVDHSGAGGPCPDGKLKCANGCCNATELSAGTSHTCAVAGEEARCWGANDQLQLGHASQDSYVPVKADVPGKVTAIAAGAAHTCAIADGKVWCWGDNTYGQVGNGNTTGPAKPQEVAGLSDMEFLAAGGGHTCAASRSKMVCWGRDDFGQLGNGGSLGEQHLEPTTVINVDALVKIAAGDAHTCAATSSGVLCWGQNSSGQLGNGAASPPSSTPAPVSPTLSATFLGLGANHSCAGTASGDLYCWGANEPAISAEGQVRRRVGGRRLGPHLRGAHIVADDAMLGLERPRARLGRRRGEPGPGATATRSRQNHSRGGGIEAHLRRRRRQRVVLGLERSWPARHGLHDHCFDREADRSIGPLA